MMPASVINLPQRAAPKAAQLEPMLVGAALALSIGREVFETLAITGEEFHVELHRKAWRIARRQAELGLPTTVADVFARGLSIGWLHQGEHEALDALAMRSTLDVAGLKRITLEYRNLVDGQRYLSQLRQAIQRVESQGFDAATEGGFLDATVAAVRAQGAVLEPMTLEQQRFLDDNRERVASGRSRIIRLGIPCFDELYGGAPESVTVVVGDGGAGKTAWADSTLESMLLANPEAKACLISPEDGTAHFLRRTMAREMGWKMRDFGSRKPTPGEEEQMQTIAGRQYPLLERLLGWKHRGITAQKLVQLCWQAAREGVRWLVIDNFNKLRISGLRGDFVDQVRAMSDSLQECGEQAGIGICMLVHSTEDMASARDTDSSGGMHGGRSMPRDARLRLDLFSKGERLRMRVQKANELGPSGKVFQFDRFADAGLVDFKSGGLVDLHAEKREEAEAKLSESIDLGLKRKAMTKAKTAPKPEAAKPTEPEPQAELDLAEANRKAKEAAVEKPSGFGMRWVDGERAEGDE